MKVYIGLEEREQYEATTFPIMKKYPSAPLNVKIVLELLKSIQETLCYFAFNFTGGGGDGGINAIPVCPGQQEYLTVLNLLVWFALL